MYHTVVYPTVDVEFAGVRFYVVQKGKEKEGRRGLQAGRGGALSVPTGLAEPIRGMGGPAPGMMQPMGSVAAQSGPMMGRGPPMGRGMPNPAGGGGEVRG